MPTSIIFYALTLNRQNYFIPHPDQKLTSFTGIQDVRTLYDVFHGLFTYTTTLYSLSNCYECEIFSEEIKIEVLGRIGFYLQKFGIDISYLENQKIFSLKGLVYFNMFTQSYNYLLKKYETLISSFTYTNQKYFYSHSDFLMKN